MVDLTCSSRLIRRAFALIDRQQLPLRDGRGRGGKGDGDLSTMDKIYFNANRCFGSAVCLSVERVCVMASL